MGLMLAQVLMGKIPAQKILFLTYNKAVSVQVNKLISEAEPGSVFELTDMPEESGYYTGTYHKLKPQHLHQFRFVIADEAQDYWTIPDFSSMIADFQGVFITFAQTDVFTSGIELRTETVHSASVSLKHDRGFPWFRSRRRQVVERAFSVEKDQYPVFSVESMKALSSLPQRVKDEVILEVGAYATNIQATLTALEKNQHAADLSLNELKESQFHMLRMMGVMMQKLEDVHTGIKAIREDIQSLHLSIGHIQDKFETLRAEVDNEQDLERLIHNCSEQLLEVIRKGSPTEHEKIIVAESRLMLEFEEQHWVKLTMESRQFLSTANVLFDLLLPYGDRVDYSPACIPLTKALEKELYTHLFVRAKKYLIHNGVPLDKWPDGMIHYNHRSRSFYPIEDQKFTLGTVPYLLGKSDMNLSRTFDYFETMSGYFQDQLFEPGYERETRDYLRRLSRDVHYITVNFRNQAAHKNRIKQSDAKQCYDYIIAVTGVLVEFARRLKCG
jgi:hypothetical protein